MKIPSIYAYHSWYSFSSFTISHNLTGIWAYYKALHMKIELKELAKQAIHNFISNGQAVTLVIQVRKADNNGNPLEFCSDSIFYQRFSFHFSPNSLRKNKSQVPVEFPIISESTISKAMKMSLYFQSTCQKENCIYFLLYIQVCFRDSNLMRR